MHIRNTRRSAASSIVLSHRWVIGRQALLDVLSILSLIVVAISLIFRNVSRSGLSHDGFLLTYAAFQGDLQAINLLDIKDPGRPFVGLSIKLAELFFGGSVTGINILMAASYTASALLIYYLGRLLLPAQPVWAIVAASLKLTWSANPEIYDNSGVIIYFGEAVFWLAVVQFVVSSRRPTLGSCTTMAMCVAIASGTYQGLWPLIVLAPACLIVTRAVSLQSASARYSMIIWTAAAVPIFVWSTVIAFRYVDAVRPTISTYLGRILIGCWNALFVSIENPLAFKTPSWSNADTFELYLLLLPLLLLWAIYGFIDRSPIAELSRRASFRIVCCGLVAVVGAVAATTLKFDPSYGSRFMAIPANGVALILCGLSALLVSAFGRRAQVLSLGFLAVFLVFSCRQLDVIADGYGANGFVERRFWEDMSVELPRMDEGTVVVFETAPPAGVATFDWFSTRIMRTLSDTHLTFFVGERASLHSPDGWKILTNVDLNQVAPDYSRGNKREIGADDLRSPVIYATYYDRTPVRTQDVREYVVPDERVVVLEWDAIGKRLWIDRRKSNMSRVHADIPSTYGQSLFPAKEIVKDRQLAQRTTTQ